MAYTKKCKICGNSFESDAKSTKYCSEKCAKRGAKKAYRSRKMKHINAVKRGDDEEIEKLIAAARKLSREVAKLCVHKVCSCKNKDHVCEGDLQVHHINHFVLDNSPQNLQWLCEKAHRELHNTEEDCSNIEEIKAYVTIRKQAEIRARNSKKQAKVDKSKN